ncbi:nuclear transport factor 2 family protein [Massilia sp. 9096]|uniref:nuclear transport factor 2 family protein n=1 Tax=Massilia sp. 9096 TaxID=1500894 RepID=UPI00056D6231|nr:nuclear transport factor 2 family protein [Massilia sp. 9096]
MRPLAALALACTLCLSTPVHPADAPNHDADVAAINKIVAQFKTAVIAHDGKTLGSLFLQDHDSWLEVADAKTWADVKTRHPDAPKVMHSSWKQFANDVQAGSKPIEERFYNVRIETNGAVASVWFDFDFLADGKLNNRGSESWQLVRAEDGWKISSMLYSIGR